MTLLYGAAVGSGTAGWNHTLLDRSVALPPGAVVTAIGLYATTAKTMAVKITKENSSSNHDIVVSQSFAHPGGGWADCVLTTSFTVPSGTYRMGGYTPSTNDVSVGVDRATQDGNITGTGQGFTVSTGAVIPVRATIEGGSSPPPSNSTYIAMIAGQSGGLNLFNQHGALVSSVFEAIVPNATLTLLCTSDGGSTYEQWAPGGAYLNGAISAFNAAVTAGAAPGFFIWDHGENPACYADQAIKADELDAAIFAAFRSGVGQPNLPILVNEIHANSESIRPWWAHVQDKKRLVCDSAWRNYVPDTIPVSVADLDETTDGVHLTNAMNQIKARRWAVALGAALMP